MSNKLTRDEFLRTDEYLNQREAAKFCGCSQKILRRFVAAGQLLEYQGFSKREHLYKKSDLEALMVVKPLTKGGPSCVS